MMPVWASGMRIVLPRMHMGYPYGSNVNYMHNTEVCLLNILQQLTVPLQVLI